MVVTAVPFFLRSFRINEQSMNAGGLPQWPAKSLIMIGFALLLLQGLSELIKRVAVMRGLIPDPFEHVASTAEAEAERVMAAVENRRALIASVPFGAPKMPEMFVSFLAQNMAPIMFASLIIVLLLGYPAAFSLAAVGLIYRADRHLRHTSVRTGFPAGAARPNFRNHEQ